MVRLIDTHCHIYAEQFEADINEVLNNAKMQGLERILMPNIDLESVTGMLRLAADHPGFCIPMMGLHPCSVKEDYQDTISQLFAHFSDRDFIGVGEIGIDLYWDQTSLEWQQKALEIQVAFAVQKGLPIALHTRNAVPQTLEVIRGFRGSGLKGVFHCFSEGYEFIDEIVDLGFYFGIGGVLTYKKSGLAEAIPAIPSERILLETDAPYLAPVPFRGKRNEPAYVWHVAKQLAEVKQMTLAEVGQMTSENAQRLFSI